MGNESNTPKVVGEIFAAIFVTWFTVMVCIVLIKLLLIFAEWVF